MSLDQSGELIQIPIHPGGLWIGGFLAGWRLLDTEAVGTVGREIEPGNT